MSDGPAVAWMKDERPLHLHERNRSDLARGVFEPELTSQPGAGFAVGTYPILGKFHR